MKPTRVIAYPVNKAKDAWASAKGRSYTNVGDYTLGGGVIGLIGGGIVGAASGLVLPLYLGWQIGNYVSDKADLPAILRFGADVVGAIVLTGISAEVTIPLVALAGAAAGGIGGLAGGTVVGGVKLGLESIVSKEKDLSK